MLIFLISYYIKNQQNQFIDCFIEKLNISFTVKNKSRCKKINLNDASVKELSNFPFFRYQLAKEIVIYRTMNGSLTIEDLSKIKGFPIEKIKIIALYLDF